MRKAIVWEIVRKDLAELRGNRYVWSSIFVLPVFLLLDATLTTTSAGSGSGTGLLIGSSLLLLTPALISVVIAAPGIVQEKTNKSLEPLLATPISDTELLWGKAVAPLIPALAANYLSFTAFILLVDSIATSAGHAPPLPNVAVLFDMFVAGTLLGFLATFATLIISSRMKDVRTAQQFSMLVVLPVFVAVVAVIAFVGDTPPALIAISGVLLLAVASVARLAERTFHRSTILVNWV
ncbi:MAG: ABC transporter permease [Thermoplasmata archaeon]